MTSEVIEQRKDFLPAAGHDLLLPLYDPLDRLLGSDRARSELIGQAVILPGQSVLDLGCGTGTLAIELKRQYPTVQVLGIDPDEKALRRAKKKATRAETSVQFDRGFGNALPYETDSFDRVFSSYMFHHLEEPDREDTLREVIRVLKTDGAFHLLDFTSGGAGSHGHLFRLVHGSERLKDNSNARLMELMRRAGLKDVENVKEGKMLFGLLRTAYFRAKK